MSGQGEVATNERTGKIEWLSSIYIPLAILQFRSIRWLSWGQVLEWILYNMLAILNASQEGAY